HCVCLLLTHSGHLQVQADQWPSTAGLITMSGNLIRVRNHCHELPETVCTAAQVCCVFGTECITNCSVAWPLTTLLPAFETVPAPAKADRLSVVLPKVRMSNSTTYVAGPVIP